MKGCWKSSSPFSCAVLCVGCCSLRQEAAFSKFLNVAGRAGNDAF